MAAFDCPTCARLVYFENFSCLNCGTRLGFDPGKRQMVAVNPHLACRCANNELGDCNWLVKCPAADEPRPLCLSCGLTRTRPHDADLSEDASVRAGFVRAEAAKRRLILQLLELDLPLGDGRLGFDLLSSKREPVIIGHANGVITVDLAESNDAHRERIREELGEPYRTMLGHLRHEIGHYYWDTLVKADEAALLAFRTLFGDERADYPAALQRHYDEAPPAGWQERYVSTYATAHPWEDWSETFAHYLHIRETLRTAAVFGLIVIGRHLDPSQMAAPNLDPDERFEDIMADWIPASLALNAINRSMGKDDLYPFVLSPTTQVKLAFVHEQVRRASARRDVR